MKIEVYRALWGMEGPLEQQFERIAAAGYDGAEVWLTGSPFNPQQILQLAEQHHLRLIVAGAIATIAEIQSTLQTFAEYDPVKINIQSGVDSMTFDEGKRFVAAMLDYESKHHLT
ncbi:MAG: hypothetical protein ABI970_05420, partial [Chloroflexota bacterium]